MRFWIILGAMVVADAINPGHTYNSVFAYGVIAAIVIGLLLDIFEIFKLK